MTLARTGSDPMDAPVTAAADASWLGGAIASVIGALGLGGIGTAVAVIWRAGGRFARIEEKLEAQDKVNANVETRLAARETAHGALAVLVAALPDREEMKDMFKEVREDIRELRREG